jgi:hypothetical protein
MRARVIGIGRGLVIENVARSIGIKFSLAGFRAEKVGPSVVFTAVGGLCRINTHSADGVF